MLDFFLQNLAIKIAIFVCFYLISLKRFFFKFVNGNRDHQFKRKNGVKISPALNESEFLFSSNFNLFSIYFNKYIFYLFCKRILF